MTVVSAIRFYGSGDPAAGNRPCRGCSGYPVDQTPGQRAELWSPSPRLLTAISAMTHARLGVDLADSHVDLLASHCDIDRAMSLLEALASTVTSQEVR